MNLIARRSAQPDTLFLSHRNKEMFPPGTCLTWTVISLWAQADALFIKHLDGNIQDLTELPRTSLAT